MGLITVAEAENHLRVDSGDDTAAITAYIAAASAAIKTYCGDGIYSDEALTVVRDDVKSACKLLVGDFYRYRDSQSNDKVDGQYGYGYLPNYVTALLFPYRQLVMI